MRTCVEDAARRSSPTPPPNPTPIPDQELIGQPLLRFCIHPSLDRISCLDCCYQITDDGDSCEQERGGEIAWTHGQSQSGTKARILPSRSDVPIKSLDLNNAYKKRQRDFVVSGSPSLFPHILACGLARHTVCQRARSRDLCRATRRCLLHAWSCCLPLIQL
jgi:hypothetical protein